MLSKSLKQILEASPGLSGLLGHRKSTGSVTIDKGKPLVSVAVINEHSTRLVWSDPLVAKYKVNVGAITEQYKLSAGESFS